MYVADAEFIVDASGKPYIKEFTLVKTSPGQGIEVLIHELVKPPCSWTDLPRRYQTRCSWMARNLHGHKFGHGRINLNELRLAVEAEFPEPGYVYFVKGEEKAWVLEETFGYTVASLDEAPSTKECDVVVPCEFEHARRNCSKRKAIFYAGWLKENPDQDPLLSLSPLLSPAVVAAIILVYSLLLQGLGIFENFTRHQQGLLPSAIADQADPRLLVPSCPDMSKRAADLAIRPTKLRTGNVWNIIPDDDAAKNKEFKPVEGGPKTKLPKTFVLNFTPRMEVSITLNGCHPEVRFVGTDACFYMTGEEFLDISGFPQSSTSLDVVRLEALEDEGYRLARYRPTESGMPALFPLSVMEMNKFAAKRLKSKLEAMCEHVCALQESEPVICAMFDCIADSYRTEYVLSNSLVPITEQFPELCRIVETYVPSVVIVKAFLEKLHEQRLVSRFNHYNLALICSSQRHFLLDLLK